MISTWILSSRDHPYSLLDIVMMSPNVAEVLDMVMKYAVFHDIQPLTMHIDLTGTARFDSVFNPLL